MQHPFNCFFNMKVYTGWVSVSPKKFLVTDGFEGVSNGWTAWILHWNVKLNLGTGILRYYNDQPNYYLLLRENRKRGGQAGI